MALQLTTHVILIKMPLSRAHDSMFIRRCKRIIAKFSGVVDEHIGFMREEYKEDSSDELLIPANFDHGQIPVDLDLALDGMTYTVCSVDQKTGLVTDCDGVVLGEAFLARQSAVGLHNLGMSQW